jgi:hypothetical protein
MRRLNWDLDEYRRKGFLPDYNRGKTNRKLISESASLIVAYSALSNSKGFL